jgi:hypothetical protein
MYVQQGRKLESTPKHFIIPVKKLVELIQNLSEVESKFILVFLPLKCYDDF